MYRQGRWAEFHVVDNDYIHWKGGLIHTHSSLHDQSGLTFFDPQLSNPWHADQNRVFVTYVEFVSLSITVIPIRFVDSGSKSVYHPSPES